MHFPCKRIESDHGFLSQLWQSRTHILLTKFKPMVLWVSLWNSSPVNFLIQFDKISIQDHKLLSISLYSTKIDPQNFCSRKNTFSHFLDPHRERSNSTTSRDRNKDTGSFLMNSPLDMSKKTQYLQTSMHQLTPNWQPFSSKFENYFLFTFK